MYSTQEYYVETQLGKNHIMIFLYYIKITFSLPAPIGWKLQLLEFIAPTRRRLQPLGFTSTHWMEAPTP